MHWEGLDLDLKVRLATPSSASEIWESGNLEMLLIRDRARKKTYFPTTLDVTGQKFQGCGPKMNALILTVRDLDCHSRQGKS